MGRAVPAMSDSGAVIRPGLWDARARTLRQSVTQQKGNDAMAGESETTTDHDTIRRWAEDRGGRPAAVGSTGSSGDVGIIRIEFPAYGGDNEDLEEISWEQWFEKFDDNELALVYQDQTSDGEQSTFNKLVSRG